ncbi:MAG TPA: glycosyltransferase family 9 protein, partial [Pirellulales bacterium]|nr:glycosyltransferase family 9 protein [Pirellulales bacterium]
REPAGLKVGLAWAGRSTHKNDHNRSLPLSLLAPLAAVPGIHFYSLQKGGPSSQAQNPPAGMRLTDWTDELADFADTAALVTNLDLVISVDTAVAHLTGALGKPVWLLAPHVSDWRWPPGRDDSGWYPTMRVFRQPRAGRWSKVIERAARELSALF